MPVRVRVPKELVEAIELEGEGDRTYGLVTMLDRAKDAKDALGLNWVQIMGLAYEAGCTEGNILGQLALETLSAMPKGARTFSKQSAPRAKAKAG